MWRAICICQQSRPVEGGGRARGGLCAATHKGLGRREQGGHLAQQPGILGYGRDGLLGPLGGIHPLRVQQFPDIVEHDAAAVVQQEGQHAVRQQPHVVLGRLGDQA